MVKAGRAIAYGAITVVNAISCGLGAALGIRLRTEAYVKLTNEPKIITGKILSDPGESKVLIEKAVNQVLRYLKMENLYGAYVETNSDIPIARGLKSSSVAANAIVLATASALGVELDDITAIKLGVEASIEAGVTITGAFDDACASYFGDIVITDNIRQSILRRIPVKDYKVLIHVPDEKAYTAKSDVRRMRLIADEIKLVHKMALMGRYWEAMTINGVLYSAVLGYDPKIAIDALSAGAIASGLSGKGPAVAAVVPEDRVDSVREAWETYDGRIIETEINHKKAHKVV